MTKIMNPFEVADNLRDTYLRYLETSFYLKDQDLQRQFRNILEDKSQPPLVRPPILEITPSFVTGKSLPELIEKGILSTDFEDVNRAYLNKEKGEGAWEKWWHRPLYRHQEIALQKAITEKRNLVIATGTGSGKTECFMYPVINHLLREKERGTLSEPGVRALFLYPMNALANDQIARLRELLKGHPDITFGRYTGETEQSLKAAISLHKSYHNNEDPLPNEMVCRDQMQENPPHILFTNYAMLEYLMIRPKDSSLFQGDRWRFIVLDEVHSYSGALGVEISLLLRRVKERVWKSKRNQLQCIGTSATLGEGEKDYPRIAQFASDLFGEDFVTEDVVGATRQSLNSDILPWGEGSSELYQSLKEEIFSGSEPSLEGVLNVVRPHVPEKALSEAVFEAKKAPEIKTQCQVFIHKLLSGDKQVQKLRSILQQENAIELPVIEKSISGCADLVAVGSFAREQNSANPLIPARYHIMARAIAGVFASYEKSGKIGLIGRRRKKHKGRVVFEIASCNRCGEVMLVGENKSGYLEHPPGVGDSPLTKNMVWLVLKPDDLDEEDEDELVQESKSSGTKSELFPMRMCMICGRLHDCATFDGETCDGHESEAVDLYQIPTKLGAAWKPRRCPSCKNSYGVVASRALTGKEAPVAVLATSLYQKTPSSNNTNELLLPGAGRKLMMFSDSRQDAAFFAPFMDSTYNKFKQRRYLVLALQQARGPMDFEDWEYSTIEAARNSGEWDDDVSASKKSRDAAGWIFREWIATDRRLALEGAGVVSIRARKSKRFGNFAVSSVLSKSPWNLSEDEQWILIQILLDSLRYQGIVSLGESKLDHTADIFKPRNVACYLRGSSSESKNKIYAWEPQKNYQNKRLDYLRRLAIKKGVCEEEARGVALVALQNIWQCIVAPNSPLNGLFETGLTHKRVPNLFRLKPQQWEVVLATNTQMFRCDTCGTVTALAVESLCALLNCKGNMLPFERPQMEKNHYHNLFTHMNPIPLAVREHTAQLTKKVASDVQQKFINGEINMLSCTTTFEMGVDVGDLQCVFMRNMPPNPGNYIQRAGRAGRRADNAAIIVTYAQRRTHDYAYFDNWRQMVKGAIQPPHIHINNVKITRRHVHAEALTEFYHHNRDLFADKLEALFDPAEDRCDVLTQFLAKHPMELEERLKRVVPTDIQSDIGLDDWGWYDGESLDEDVRRECFTERLALAREDVCLDWEALSSATEKAWAARDHRWAGTIERQLNTLKHRSLLGRLGTYSLIPKYGFPTDVVELKVRSGTKAGSNVELSRDMKLALSEFGPGNQVIANGQVWTSRGVVLPSGERKLHEYVYWHCPECHFFSSQKKVVTSEDSYPDKPCLCDGAEDLSAKKYLYPEFGFTTEQGVEGKVGESRPTSRSYSQAFFQESSVDLEYLSIPQYPSVKYKEGEPGWIHVINDNREDGFQVCMFCGYTFNENSVFATKKGVHMKPWTNDQECQGNPTKFALGYRYKTDVLELKMPTDPLKNIPLSSRSMINSLWLSVLYTLVNAACRKLEISNREIDGCLNYSIEETPSLVLFDTAPGGGGFVKTVQERFAEVLEEAQILLGKECCGEDTSCIVCLRTYSNQRHHNSLVRGLAHEYFSKLTDAVPTENTS